MLKQFSSNSRKLNRVISKINPNNLVNSDLTGSLLNIEIPSSIKHNSKTRNSIVVGSIINPNNLNTQSYLTSSLENIEIPTTSSFNSNIKSNPNSTQIVNNKNKIKEFYDDIFSYSVRSVQRQIDEYNNVNNTLTIYNVALDYGTEQPSPENFEIIVFGLHIPSDYIIEQIENNVVITLGSDYIDFENTFVTDIYVIGKLLEIPISSEDDYNLTTEDGLDLII